MSSPHLPLARTLGAALRSAFAHRVPWMATVLALAIGALGGCAATPPRPATPPTASRAPGPCWLLNIEELTNNTFQHQDDSLQLVATYRFGSAEHDAGSPAHSPFELSSRTDRWRPNEWTDHLRTHPTTICTPEGLQPPDLLNDRASATR